MLQQLVDGWITEIEGSVTVAPVVRIADFPNPAYEDDGFWSTVDFKAAYLLYLAWYCFILYRYSYSGVSCYGGCTRGPSIWQLVGSAYRSSMRILIYV